MPTYEKNVNKSSTINGVNKTCSTPLFGVEYFDAVGSDTDVYNNNEEMLDSPGTDRFQSVRCITKSLFVYQIILEVYVRDLFKIH